MAEAKTGRTGGKLLADALVAQGVTHAFCVPGESYLDLLDGLYSVRNRLQLVTCRFEAGAIHMAEAYGKLTGKPGVAIVTRPLVCMWRSRIQRRWCCWWGKSR
jgi:acetolactate synthase-1/2/3 large subunit